jgi:hypothetical protein
MKREEVLLYKNRCKSLTGIYNEEVLFERTADYNSVANIASIAAPNTELAATITLTAAP